MVGVMQIKEQLSIYLKIFQESLGIDEDEFDDLQSLFQVKHLYNDSEFSNASNTFSCLTVTRMESSQSKKPKCY